SAQADGDPHDAQDGPEQGGCRVLLRDEVHDDHHHERMRHVVAQDGDGRDDAGQCQSEGRAAPPGGGRDLPTEEADERGGRHRLAGRSDAGTVATAEAPMRKDSSGSSTLIRRGKRAARRIQSSERSTRGSPFTLVPFSGSTAHPSPTTVPRKRRPGCDWRYRSTRAPAGMWRSWASRKFALTYQVPGSARCKTSTPVLANGAFRT